MNIGSYIESLRSRRELLEIGVEIDGRLELAVLTDLMSKKAGPGLLFTKVKESRLSIASNLFGSDKRMALALGYENLESFGRDLTTTLLSTSGESSSQRLKNLLQRVAAETRPTERTCQEVNLGQLPELRFWPDEERSFLTLAVVISRAPASQAQNYGLYRVGIVDERRLTLNLLPGSGGGQHLQQWRNIGKSMPVAILLGADPALIFAAAAPLPPDCSEEIFSAYLNRSYFQASPCQTVPLRCPASGEIVIEGWIDAEVTLNEGPFGCYTGDYGGSNVCPLVEVSALSMVADPLLPLTLAGPLPMEDCWIAKANLEIIRARLAIDLPEIILIEMPLESAFHGVYFIRSKDSLASVKELAQAMRGLDYLARIKMLILLGDKEDPVTETNWREIIKTAPSRQIWQDPHSELAALLNRHPASLHHNPRLLSDLLPRLRLDASEISAEKG